MYIQLIKMRKKAKIFKLFHSSLPILILCLIDLCSSIQILLQYSPQDSVVMQDDNTINSDFKPSTNSFSCANHILFTINQTHTQYLNQTPTIIIFNNITNTAQVSISTYYNFINPTLSTNECSGTVQEPECSIAIQNNCKDITYFRFFDTIQLDINLISSDGEVYQSSTFVYNIICDDDVVRNAFEVGLIILIIYAGVVIGITSRCSVAKSWKNREWSLGYFSIIGFTFFAGTGIFFIFSPLQDSTSVITDIVLICSLIYGVFSVMVCFTELLYKRNKYLNMGLGCNSRLKVRIMDIIGFLLGVGVMAGWWFSQANWILSDFIFTCMLIVTIKMFRFNSLKAAVFAFVLVTSLFIIFIAIAEVLSDNSFNSLMLSIFNNPFFLVCPTITAVPNQPCSWISIISLAYPGLVLSYLESFDDSRKTRIYTVVFLIGFVVMSILWTLINVAVPMTLPFDLITSPLIIIIICLFANRRNQLNILWNGTFNRQSSRMNTFQLSNTISQERSPSKISHFRDSLFHGLRFERNSSDFSRSSHFSNRIRELL